MPEGYPLPTSTARARWGRNGIAVILQCGTRISSFSITRELVRNANYRFPPQTYLSRNSGWGPAICVLTSPLGDCAVLSLTEKREYKFSKAALKSSPVETWRGDPQSRSFNYCPGWVGLGRLTCPRPPRAHTPPAVAAPRTARLLRPGPRRPLSRSRVGGRGAAGPSRGRACRPQPPPARPAPLSAPRAAPSRPRGVRALGGVGAEEGRGREGGGAGRPAECKGGEPPPHTRLPSRPACRKGLLWPAREPERNHRPGAGWRLPLGGSRRSLPGPGAAAAGGVGAGPSAEPAAALGGRARLSGGEGQRVGRGGAGLRRSRAPAPPPPVPAAAAAWAARAGGDACAPRRAACARARGARRRGPARGTRPGGRRGWRGRASGAGRKGREGVAPGRKGSANIVTAGVETAALLEPPRRAPEEGREARRPSLGRSPWLLPRHPALISSRSCDMWRKLSAAHLLC